MNNKRFEHNSKNGTDFFCNRCDFKEPVLVKKPEHISEEMLLQDLAEMIAYHSFNVWHQLNGFSGYDTIEFKIAV